jgi:hypothetical protein
MARQGTATVTQAVLMLLKAFVGTGVLFLGRAYVETPFVKRQDANRHLQFPEWWTTILYSCFHVHRRNLSVLLPAPCQD